MNFKALFCGIAAAAMFTACSNDEPNGGNTPETGGELSDGGYITVGINLPKQAAGGMHARQRTNANDQFDHGTANEYAVKNAMLLVFTGDKASEKNAVFHSAYDLSMTPPQGGVNGPSDLDANITTTYLKTVHLNNISDGDYLWGLVLVNYDNIATEIAKYNNPSEKPDDIFPGLITSMKLGDIELKSRLAGLVPEPSAVTFDYILNNCTTSHSFINDKYIFMTNAVVSTADADGATANTVYTLQKIGLASTVAKPTEAEAQAYPAASFYVERAVAKATLVAESATTKGDLAANNITINKVEWVLDNTEPKSYIVRNVGDNSYIAYQQAGLPKRFVGTVQIGTTALQPIANLYRHYWAIDLNYSEDANLTTAVTSKSMPNSEIPANLFKEAGSNAPQYCHENTFDVDHMTYQNTTRALLKVTFGLADGTTPDLYTVNNLQREGNIFKSLADASTLPIQAIIESVTVHDAVKDALQPGQSAEINSGNVDQFLNIEFGIHNESNVVYVKSITLNQGSGKYKESYNFAQWDEAFATLAANTSAAFRIVKYEKGVAYYDIRFKHFGDDYTPWSKTGSIQYASEAYEGNLNDYLGRWGMVRNNWYEINLTGIKQLGMPVIGQLFVDNTPDDNQLVEKWLSFKINILSWAKRVQNEEL